jgi:hypothetical protein
VSGCGRGGENYGGGEDVAWLMGCMVCGSLWFFFACSGDGIERCVLLFSGVEKLCFFIEIVNRHLIVHVSYFRLNWKYIKIHYDMYYKSRHIIIYNSFQNARLMLVT